MITPANFSIFVTNVNTMIGEAYKDTVEPIKEQISTEVPFESETLTFGWTGMLPQMRVWEGPRVANEAAPQTYSQSALPFEFTLTLDRFRLDDDQFGIYYRQLPDMARQAKRWPILQLRNLLEAAFPFSGASFQAGLDGLPNFSTAHPVDLYNQGAGGPGTYCNDFTGGGQTIGGILIGGAFSPTAFATLYEYNSILKGEDNEPLGITPNLLVHPAQLKTEVDYVLKSAFFAAPTYGTLTGQVGAADNMFKRFGVEPLEHKFLKSASKWYLLDTTKPMKPLVWGLREAPIFVQRTNEDDPTVFDLHQYTWGNWGRAVPMWSYAWLMARSGP